MFNVFKSLFTPKEAERKSPNVIIPLPSDEAGNEAFFQQYIDVLLAHGWKMEPAQTSHPDSDVKCYASGALVKAGEDVIKFVSLFKTLMKESENVWYNSIEDFSNDSTEGEGCAWNEFAKEDLVRATS